VIPIRNLLDKAPGSKTITLVVVAVIINILAMAGIVGDAFAAEIVSKVLFPAALGTAYLGYTRK
jgi:hypothetical protein